MNDKERKAMFAKLKNVQVSFHKSLNNNDDNVTVIPLGARNKQSKQYGLPLVVINRADALRIRKEKAFSKRGGGYGSTYHVGEITGDEFNQLVKSKTNQDYKNARKNFKKTSDTKPKPKPVPESTKEPDFTIAKEMHKQLSDSKVNGFPFYAYTGAKPVIISGSSINLTVPSNPNHIKKINVDYDHGRDEYNLRFLKASGKIDELKGVYADQLSDIIVDRMGVR